jgi:GTP-binding protein YchF
MKHNFVSLLVIVVTSLVSAGTINAQAPNLIQNGSFEQPHHMSSTSLAIGIVGLPNVGKSTLFNALTKKSVLAANYPFATIDPSVGVVAVPDERLWKLSEFSKSAKTIPAAVEFVDIAGLVKGASEGEGLGNKFLQNIRETDAIAEVVRIFDDENIIHVANKIEPLKDIEVINLELIMADLQTVTKRLTGLEKDAKRGDKSAVIELGALKQIEEALKAGRLASSVALGEKELPLIRGLHFLTMKPILYVLNKKAGGRNLDEGDTDGDVKSDTNKRMHTNETNGGKDKRFIALMDFLKKEKAGWVIVDAKIEEDLKEMEGAEKEMFRKELMGDNASSSQSEGDDGVNNLIRAGYDLLGLITYFTTGLDETRAWTIKNGWTAPMAGTAIHTDFKDKFIRAEVIEWDKLLAAGSYAAAREKGLVRTEGKEYVVKDGDVIEFKI